MGFGIKAKVGDITMANELLYVKIDKLEAGRPLTIGLNPSSQIASLISL